MGLFGVEVRARAYDLMDCKTRQWAFLVGRVATFYPALRLRLPLSLRRCEKYDTRVY